MVEVNKFYDKLLKEKMDLFVGVPDSLLASLCSYIKDNASKDKNIIAANEGNAIAIASGYHISSGNYGVVYMQNSGIGNAVNPLLSLADEQVYSIPMLIIVGWRGEPGIKDEPQHVKQGQITLELFDTMGIDYVIADDTYIDQIDYCKKYMMNNSKPIALIIKKDYFNKYKSTSKIEPKYELLRETALESIVNNIGDSIVVSTTGKTSREIFEIREKNKESHDNDFLTVGSMGHTSSIASGIAIGTDRDVYCIDGDGSFIMHMGASAIISQLNQSNLKYVIINNGSHESVGGQPTVGFDIDIESILKSVGVKNIYSAKTEIEIIECIKNMQNSTCLSATVIYTKTGSRDDLGRPTLTPLETKLNLMKKIQRR